MKIDGFDQMIKNLESFKQEASQVVARAVFHGATLIQNEAKSNHGADAHAIKRYENQTTNLTNSIQAQQPEVSGDSIRAEVVAGEEYAADVELGTPKHRPYPFMVPAMESQSKTIIEGIRGVLKAIKWVN